MGSRGGARTRSEAEHVVEAERPFAAEKAVIAEEPAGGVADEDVAAAPGAGDPLGPEDLAGAPEERAGAGDGDPLARHLGAAPVGEDEVGRAGLPPRRRGRVDEVAERVVARRAEPEEEPGREAGRP